MIRDLKGLKFNRLTVINYDHKDASGKSYWKCQCDCGNVVIVRSDCLTTGNTKACGCMLKEMAGTKAKRYLTKHNLSKTRLYKIWKGMIYRCRHNVKNYGERGVAVCDEWLHNFQSFYNWSTINGYDDSLSIDRIDVNGNYEPSNCRWATILEQERNKTNTCYVVYNGKKTTLKELAEESGINYHKLWARINKLDWSVEKAVNYKHGKKF